MSEHPMQWFAPDGDEWSPGFDPNGDLRIETPTFDTCLGCGDMIMPNDRGVMIWAVKESAEGYEPYHLKCMLINLFGPDPDNWPEELRELVFIADGD